MPLNFELCVDWDADDFTCRYARPGDTPNLFGKAASSIGSLYRRVVGVGVSVVVDDPGLTAYGKTSLLFTTGTTTISNYLDIGFDGTLYNIPSGLYQNRLTAVLWVKSESATYNDVPLSLKIVDGGVEKISFDFTCTFAEGWKKVTVTTNLGTFSQPHIRFTKRSSGTAGNGVFRISGPMLYTGTFVPVGFNNGYASTYDNISSFVSEVNWSLGFNRSYQDIPSAGRLNVTLINKLKYFSPESTSSPLSGYLKTQRKIVVHGVTDAYDNVMFTGWIDKIAPQAGANGPRLCRIEASDARKFLDGKTLHIDVQTNKTARQLLFQQIFPALDLPNTTNYTPTIPPPEDWEEVFPYALDNHEDGVDALRMMKDVIGTIQGKIWFNRTGSIVFADLRDLGGSSTVIATLDNNFQDPDYRYGDTVINECIVPAYRRKVSAAVNKLLWESEETITIDPYDTEEIIATFKNPDTDNDRKIAGIGVYVTMTADAGVSYSLDTSAANSAVITLTNSTGSAANVTLLEVRGQKLTAFNQTERRNRNEASIAEFGVRSKRLDYKLMNNKKTARRLARYITLRFGQPFAEMQSVTLVPKDDASQALMLNLQIGQKVRIIEDQTDHDGYYNIIGEEHHVVKDAGATKSKFFVEPIYRGFVTDDPVLGLTDNGNYVGLY